MKKPIIIPSLTYKDARRAIDWLVKAFGFQKHLVVDGDDGKVMHAELALNGAMIMLGSHDSGSEFSRRIKTPNDVGGFETQSPYVVIEDVDALYLQAKKHGAQIVIELKEESYGGKGFSCLDLEGHLWSFGSYDPRNVNEK